MPDVIGLARAGKGEKNVVGKALTVLCRHLGSTRLHLLIVVKRARLHKQGLSERLGIRTRHTGRQHAFKSARQERHWHTNESHQNFRGVSPVRGTCESLVQDFPSDLDALRSVLGQKDQRRLDDSNAHIPTSEPHQTASRTCAIPCGPIRARSC